MHPLEGIRVLDLTRLLPGAISTLFLADMGAEIIKIEAPGGGDYARWMPPLVNEIGAYFKASNRDKRSVIIDLKSKDGQAVLHRLVQDADVLIEGFRPGVTARLCADYDTLREINPRIVYCSLSGYGQDGPDAQISGHDLNYVALSGLQGAQKAALPLGGQIGDVGGAYAGAMGIVSALFRRERTGTGAYLDISLFEAALPFALYQIVESAVTGVTGGAGGLTGGAAYYDIYTSSDDQPMALAAIEPKFWRNFCEAVDKPEWISRHMDPDQDRLKQDIAALFAQKTATEWDALLSGADCCFTRTTAPEDVPQESQIQARSMMGTDSDGVPWMRSPIRFSDENTFAPGHVPGYGENTRAVLQKAGYTGDEIDALIASGAVATNK